MLQRIEPPAGQDRFDLVIATNILIYYDVFEQLLTGANVAKMLRPGGLFLSNTLLVELPAAPTSLVSYTDVVYTDSGVGDRIFCYELQGGPTARQTNGDFAATSAYTWGSNFAPSLSY